VPLHVTLLRLIALLVVATAAGIGTFSYLNTRDAVQRLARDLTRAVAG